MTHTFQLFIVFLMENVLMVSCQKEIQPYGPKMCHLLCISNHCSEYSFDDLQLRCRLISTTPQLCLHTSNGINKGAEDTAKIKKATSSQQDKNISTVASSSCPPADVKQFLYFCANGNKIGVMRLICQAIMDFNCHGKQDFLTRLMNADLHINIDIFDFLVELTPDLSSVDDTQKSVIHYPCFCNSVDTIEKLINDHNVSIEQREAKGKTPLMVAIDAEGNNILHKAIKFFRKYFDKFILSQNLTDMESKEENGRSILMAAIILNKIPIVNFMMAKGANAYQKDKYNNTLLHIACVFDEDMVNFILSLNITDIESRGKSGRTPLMVAAYSRNIQGVKFLKGRGANINTVDDHNNTILHTACKNGDIQLVKYILSWNTIDIESKGEVGRTLLMIAVSAVSGIIPTMELLRDKGANETVVDDEGLNLFHIACERGDLETVKHLTTLEKLKGEEKMRDNAGLTPIAIARREGYSSIVKFLTHDG